jgi:hypothetical protein
MTGLISGGSPIGTNSFTMGQCSPMCLIGAQQDFTILIEDADVQILVCRSITQ